MSLTLTVLRCPDGVPPETKSVTGGEFRIGRGADNDWVLQDPEKVLSKRHCVIGYRKGEWALADTSTNGTFLNRESGPVGNGEIRPLRDRDRLRLGAYEIEVRIAEQPAIQESRRGAVSPASAFDNPFAADPLAPDPFSPAPAPGHPFGETPAAGGFDRSASIALPDRFDPLAPAEEDAPFGAAATPDHSASFTDSFRPPPVSADPLPEDWDLEPARPPAPPPAPAEAAPVRPPPFAPAEPAAAQPGLLQAFFEGAGLKASAPPDGEALMRALGAAFRATVSGIRHALIARASIKGEFRIEQTMIRARGNNPLKFSADDDDALAALLGIGRRTDMAADQAIDEALTDMRLHEMASIAAMQTAVRALLEQCDPAHFRAEAEQSGGLSVVPTQRKARAFDLYEKHYAATTQALSDDFDSAFGKAFARAYEQALRDISKENRGAGQTAPGGRRETS